MIKKLGVSLALVFVFVLAMFGLSLIGASIPNELFNGGLVVCVIGGMVFA